MSEQYRKNVQAMCDDLGIANPIHEADLNISAISFKVGRKWVFIDGTDMNRAGRLFFQYYYSALDFQIIYDVSSGLFEAGEIYFSELWLDAEEKGRALIAAFASADKIKIHWKNNRP